MLRMHVHIWYKRIVIKLQSSSPTENIELESKLVFSLCLSISEALGDDH